MTDLSRLGDADLELALRDLGAALERPGPAVDPALAVRRRLDAGDYRGAWRSLGSGRPVRRAVLLALAALLVLAGLAAALGFGLPGLRIIFGEAPSAAPAASSTAAPDGRPADPIESLDLGRAVELGALDEAAGFDVLVPQGVGLEGPIAAVRILPRGVRMASLVYPPTDRYPAGPAAAVGILVTQLPATLSDRLVVKFIESTTTFERVPVDGTTGFWIAGGLHEIGYADALDGVVVDTIRLAGNVLAWNAGGVTFRIEGAADLETALEIATALR